MSVLRLVLAIFGAFGLGIVLLIVYVVKRGGSFSFALMEGKETYKGITFKRETAYGHEPSERPDVHLRLEDPTRDDRDDTLPIEFEDLDDLSGKL